MGQLKNTPYTRDEGARVAHAIPMKPDQFNGLTYEWKKSTVEVEGN